VLPTFVKPHRDSLSASTADTQKLFVLLKAIPAGDLAAARPQLALALVIDTSGSMRDLADASTGEKTARVTKLQQAIEATRRMLTDERLQPHDQFCLISFDDEARTVSPLSPLDRLHSAQSALARLDRFSGGTHLAKGLRAAMRELNHAPQNAVRRIILLTDGEAFDEKECYAAARELGETGISLVTMGIGDEYNEELLRDLAEMAHGRPHHLPAMHDFHSVLESEIGISVREVVTDLQLAAQTVRGVSLDSITRVYPDLAEIPCSSTHYALGHMAAGDYTVWTLEFTISGLCRPEGRARLAQLQLQGFAPALGQRLSSTHDVTVQFTADENAIADVDGEVLGYIQQRNADRMVQNAVRQLKTNATAAQQSLESAAQLTRRVGNAMQTKVLEESLHELRTTGSLSRNARKTVTLSGRTCTIKTSAASDATSAPSQDVIRKLTGA
jgi:Ca-activated chloride channel homolog